MDCIRDSFEGAPGAINKSLEAAVGLAAVQVSPLDKKRFLCVVWVRLSRLMHPVVGQVIIALRGKRHLLTQCLTLPVRPSFVTF